MKKIFLSAAATLFMSAALFAQAKFSDVAKVEQEVIDQGKLKQGNPVPAKFIIINTSKAPIIIEQAQPVCGCTISDYTKTPITPGQTGYVTATFNAANVGHFSKTVNIKLANVDEPKGITLQGDVLSAEDYDKWAAENKSKPGIAAAPSKTSTKPVPVKTTTKATATKTPVKKITKKPVTTKAK